MLSDEGGCGLGIRAVTNSRGVFRHVALKSLGPKDFFLAPLQPSAKLIRNRRLAAVLQGRLLKRGWSPPGVGYFAVAVMADAPFQS